MLLIKGINPINLAINSELNSMLLPLDKVVDGFGSVGRSVELHDQPTCQ